MFQQFFTRTAPQVVWLVFVRAWDMVRRTRVEMTADTDSKTDGLVNKAAHKKHVRRRCLLAPPSMLQRTCTFPFTIDSHGRPLVDSYGFPVVSTSAFDCKCPAARASPEPAPPPPAARVASKNTKIARGERSNGPDALVEMEHETIECLCSVCTSVSADLRKLPQELLFYVLRVRANETEKHNCVQSR